jgi:hypothetical protein
MTSKLKILALALAATFALGAVAASPASAIYELHSGSGSGTTYLTAVQTVTAQLDTEKGNIKCTTVTGKGSFTGTTDLVSTIEDPTFSGCTAFGVTAHIDMMGCDFLIEGSGISSGVVHIECPTTAGGVTHEITITPTQGGVPICHIDLGEQTGVFSITNEKLPSPDDIVNSLTTKTLTYRVTPVGENTKCGSAGLRHDGALTNPVTVRAYSDVTHTNQVNLTFQ